MGSLVQKNGPVHSIACGYSAGTIEVGASIACDGCCLTVISVQKEPDGRTSFDVEVSNETLGCTTLGSWQLGQVINLERSLRLGDELGGHIVTGHVDGMADILSREPDGDSQKFVFQTPDRLKHLLAAKGSVALNGTSLTVNHVENCEFGVNIIPHTLKATNWSGKTAGDKVNLEVDLLARYVSRMKDVMDQGSQK